MASPTLHPRRRPFPLRPHVDLPDRPTLVPAHEPTSPASSSLKKSATFHSPTSPSSIDTDPILNIPSLPRRSPTDISASNSHIDQIIGAVDRSFSELKEFASDRADAPSEETLPVPRFMINTSAAADPSAPFGARPAAVQGPTRHKHHSSDSGIGSTESSAASAHGDLKPANVAEASLTGNVTSGINGAAMNGAVAVGSESALSEYACRQIQKHIIVPILKQQRLKDFHPLVAGLPHRVHRKEITCLRDLEKVLLYLAPASFLFFCETSIQCIHTAVEYLNERDQTRPADRPYTNGYFVDLVEQVRQYASMISAERARSSAQEDQQQTEASLRLVGGLSQTGRPAEFIVTRGDRFVSLRTGQEVTAEELKQGTKRGMAWSEEEEAERSMARRRKSAGPAERQEQRCSECDKTFKRPCDLTKHEKTHSRPWKCAEPACKYHEYGWPTEKERDRHMNDKHSAAPPMYKCHFPPCPYESKRESNCKQHMEKTHQWTYVRSKNNGKTGRRAAAAQAAMGRTPPTPQTDSPASAARALNSPTPDFSDAHPGHASSPLQARGSLQSPMVAPLPADAYMHDIATSSADMFAPLGQAWADANVEYSPLLPTTAGANLAWDPPQPAGPALGALRDEDTSMFGANFDWSGGAGAFDAITGLPTPMTNLQLATPATSVASHPPELFSAAPYSAAAYAAAPQAAAPASLSPTARGDVMFSSPWSVQPDGTESPVHPDDDFGDFAGQGAPVTRPAGDFALFEAASSATTAGSAPPTLFGELAPFPTLASGWSGRGTALAENLDMAPESMEP